MKNYLPYILEIGTKLFTFVAAVLLASQLSIADFGEYSYARSFALVAATLLLFGLQSSSFKFSNPLYLYRNQYLYFSLICILLISFVSWSLIATFEERWFEKYGDGSLSLIKWLVVSTIVPVFFSAYAKASGRPLVGFALVLFMAIAFFLAVTMSTLFGSISVGYVIRILIALNVVATFICCTFMFSANSASVSHLARWPLKEWISVSSSMWLSGFLPAFLLQGLLIVFGSFFANEMIGYLAIATLVVSNLALFKEVSIAIHLPLLIKNYSVNNTINYSVFFKCIFVGTFPVIIVTIIVANLENYITALYPNKLTSQVFTFFYLLALSQFLMAIYQPIFRFLSAIGLHTRILQVSLFLLITLLSFFVFTGYLNSAVYMVASPAIVSCLAVLASIFFLHKLAGKSG